MAAVSWDPQELAEFCRRWQVSEVALFGSVLSANFGPESDVDVLVSFSPNARRPLFDLVTMGDELSQIFDRPVDLVGRRGIERSRNMWRRRAILESAQTVYVA